MIKIFCPDECLGSLLDVNLDELWQNGYRGMILDIDNTLLPWAGDTLDQETVMWVRQAKEMGFRLCLTSNAFKERVHKIAAALDVPAVASAIKPRKRAFRLALDMLKTRPRETVVIGDQMFTDILGGNRMGLYTILIDPVAAEELKATKVMRRIERRIIRRLSRKGYISESAARRRLGKSKG
ncbi:MAG: YqeG family HAD IIIA-type phosphatase [Limnochordia bacterium]|jgi:HAD superfamily phosphatase (TIGR01668 family)